MAATLEIDAVIDPADTRGWLAKGPGVRPDRRELQRRRPLTPGDARHTCRVEACVLS
jgi:acetyl-CoA carboxylase carboxyltransferase component